MALTQTEFFALEHVSKRVRRRAGARRRVARRSGRANCWRWSARTAPANRRMMRLLEGVFTRRTAASSRLAAPPIAFARAARQPCRRHPRHPPGTGDRPQPDGRRKHLRRRHAAHGRHPARLAHARRADARRCSPTFGMQRDMRPRQLCATLGPAQRQMIEIMRAVRAGGRLIAFDEPTSSLTDDEARRLFRGHPPLARRWRLDRLHLAPAQRDHRARRPHRRAARRPAGRRSAGGRRSEQAIAKLMVGRDIADLFSRAEAESGTTPILEVIRPDHRRPCTTST